MHFKFTIIMCTYNGGTKISKVIDSIINQNKYEEYVKEFIIVDNNSGYETVNIIKENEKKSNKIICIKEERQGLAYARKKGIKSSTGEWIIFIDDDNILNENWIRNAYEYICNNDKIGAYNGAVISYMTEKIDKKEQIILENVLQGLACTHSSVDKINFKQKKHPYRIPFGAGLVVKGDLLRQLIEDGWIKSVGRSKANLSSCEDTEMCLYIKRKGFKWGYNPNMIIFHMISRNRLEKGYLNRLWSGFADGNYKILSSSRYGIGKIMLYLGLLYIRYMRDIIKVLLKPNYRTKYELNLIYRKRYLEDIIKSIK